MPDKTILNFLKDETADIPWVVDSQQIDLLHRFYEWKKAEIERWAKAVLERTQEEIESIEDPWSLQGTWLQSKELAYQTWMRKLGIKEKEND